MKKLGKKMKKWRKKLTIDYSLDDAIDLHDLTVNSLKKDQRVKTKKLIMFMVDYL
jgi:hypothetical protein